MNFTRLMKNYNVVPLLDELARNGNRWREDTYLRDYPQGPFADVESIILRFPPRTVHETEELLKNHLVHFDQHENKWQPIAKDYPEFKKVVFDIAHRAGATRIGRVFINKIRANGRIYPHADTPVHALYWTRFHVVVGALPGCDFRCGDEHAQFHTGDVFWFRNEFEHEVINNSPADRIHLVIDLKVEEVK